MLSDTTVCCRPKEAKCRTSDKYALCDVQAVTPRVFRPQGHSATGTVCCPVVTASVLGHAPFRPAFRCVHRLSSDVPLDGKCVHRCVWRCQNFRNIHWSPGAAVTVFRQVRYFSRQLLSTNRSDCFLQKILPAVKRRNVCISVPVIKRDTHSVTSSG
jgi:hypothetical protein